MENGTKINLQERITLYAPDNATIHTPGQEVKVGVVVAEKLEAQGYTRTAPKTSKEKGGQK